MAFFRKKPVVIEAVQFRRDNWNEVQDFGKPAVKAVGNWNTPDDVLCLNVRTLEGLMTAEFGDWIIKGVNGEFYPCRNDIFRMTYEEVSDV